MIRPISVIIAAILLLGPLITVELGDEIGAGPRKADMTRRGRAGVRLDGAVG